VIFQRLLENFQDMFFKFGELIYELDSFMRQADLAGSGKMSATDQIRPASDMVWCGDRNGLRVIIA
jgi:hypothetical protein